MSKNILVIGSSNIDLIMKIEHLPKPGETVTDGTFRRMFGGKGANQAVAAARSGGQVSLISCLGDDGFATDMIEGFQKEGIDTGGVIRVKTDPTGTALIMIDNHGENCISVAPGANYQITEDHIQNSAELIRGADLILMQGELHPLITRYLLQCEFTKDKKILLNLAPAQPLETKYLERISYLVVNEHEAETLVQKKVENSKDILDTASLLHTRIKGDIIVTMGAKGSYLKSDQVKEFIPAFQVKPIDTTAAGDVYCGSLATALVEGLSLMEASRFASAAAAISVTRMGAQASAPTREEIELFLRSNPVRKS